MKEEELVRMLTPQERIECLLAEVNYHNGRAHGFDALAADARKRAEKCMEEVRKIRRKEQK